MPRADDGATSSDLRMAAPAAAAWGTAAMAVVAPPLLTIGTCVVATAAAVLAHRRNRMVVALVAVVIAGTATICGVRAAAVHTGVVPTLAGHHVTATVRLTVTSDPRLVSTPHRRLVVFDGSVRRLTARGQQVRVRAPVVVWAQPEALAVRLGSSLEVSGRFSPSRDPEQAARLQAHRLRVVDGRAWWWSTSAAMRAAVTDSVVNQPPDVRALVPALVHGDDQGLSDELEEDFRDSGLTHLLAVSGTNLTLVIGFLLAVARPFGAGNRASIAIGVLGTIAFVVLARPEPSVLRAAVMGLVALAGLSSGGRGRGVRCLAWAVVLLVLLDPWLSRSVGFMLSTLATAGILVLGPLWRDALARWLPRWCAEGLAVPMSAQLACTPAIAAISGKVSLVAVVTNVLAGPAVGPATVLGLLGGGADLLWRPLGHLVGRVSGLFAGWIVAVGRHGAALPGAAVGWGSGPAAIVVLAAVCLVVAVVARPVLRRPLACCALASVSVVAVVRPVSYGWPPPGWVMVACDVGQGDATVLNAGEGSAVVVDAGPDPRAVDRCLDQLGVRSVPLVVLTHGHADHVDGLRGVLRGRRVAEVESGPGGRSTVRSGVPVREVVDGEIRHVGPLSWTVVWPVDPHPVGLDASDGEGSAANDASIVLLVRVSGISILLSGDIEPLAQRALLRRHPELRADVLKVPHHGSARQDQPWVASLGARYATLSAGEHNTFGHPAPRTIAMLRALGITTLRTDTQGDLAIVVRHGSASAVVR